MLKAVKAVLTGHTKGLGAALAANLLARGIGVLGIARGQAPELGAQNVQNVQNAQALRQVTLDLADSGALAAWLAGPALKDWLAGADTVLLINNAGTVQPIGPLAMHDAGGITRAVALNVAAPLMLAGAVAAARGPQAHCRIVHVSSGAARNAYAGWSVYGATKAALDQHARAVALEQNQNRDLRICSLAPGVIDTGMQAEIRATSLAQFPLRPRFDALRESGALADPAQCAQRLVSYLLSDQFGSVPVEDLRSVLLQA